MVSHARSHAGNQVSQAGTHMHTRDHSDYLLNRVDFAINFAKI